METRDTIKGGIQVGEYGFIPDGWQNWPQNVLIEYRQPQQTSENEKIYCDYSAESLLEPAGTGIGCLRGVYISYFYERLKIMLSCAMNRTFDDISPSDSEAWGAFMKVINLDFERDGCIVVQDLDAILKTLKYMGSGREVPQGARSGAQGDGYFYIGSTDPNLPKIESATIDNLTSIKEFCYNDFVHPDERDPECEDAHSTNPDYSEQIVELTDQTTLEFDLNVRASLSCAMPTVPNLSMAICRESGQEDKFYFSGELMYQIYMRVRIPIWYIYDYALFSHFRNPWLAVGSTSEKEGWIFDNVTTEDPCNESSYTPSEGPRWDDFDGSDGPCLGNPCSAYQCDYVTNYGEDVTYCSFAGEIDGTFKRIVIGESSSSSEEIIEATPYWEHRGANGSGEGHNPLDHIDDIFPSLISMPGSNCIGPTIEGNRFKATLYAFFEVSETESIRDLTGPSYTFTRSGSDIDESTGEIIGSFTLTETWYENVYKDRYKTKFYSASVSTIVEVVNGKWQGEGFPGYIFSPSQVASLFKPGASGYSTASAGPVLVHSYNYQSHGTLYTGSSDERYYASVGTTSTEVSVKMVGYCLYIAPGYLNLNQQTS